MNTKFKDKNYFMLLAPDIMATRRLDSKRVVKNVIRQKKQIYSELQKEEKRYSSTISCKSMKLLKNR